MTQEISFREILESNHYAQKREELAKEINSNRIVVDRKCFKKSLSEKTELINLKSRLENKKFTQKMVFTF
jgi:hypothetical protein